MLFFAYNFISGSLPSSGEFKYSLSSSVLNDPRSYFWCCLCSAFSNCFLVSFFHDLLEKYRFNIPTQEAKEPRMPA